MFSLNSLKQLWVNWAGGENSLLFSAGQKLLCVQPPLHWGRLCREHSSSWQAQLYLSETRLYSPAQPLASSAAEVHYFSAVKSEGVLLWVLPAVPGKGRCWRTWMQSRFAWSLVQMLVHMQKSTPERHYLIDTAVRKQREIFSLLHAVTQLKKGDFLPFLLLLFCNTAPALDTRSGSLIQNKEIHNWRRNHISSAKYVPNCAQRKVYIF